METWVKKQNKEKIKLRKKEQGTFIGSFDWPQYFVEKNQENHWLLTILMMNIFL